MNAGPSRSTPSASASYTLPGRKSIHAEAIPAELRSRAQWVIWRYGSPREEGRSGVKPPKLLFRPRSPELVASSTDEDGWATFEDAKRVYDAGECDGIGYVLSPDDPYIGVDLDECRDPFTGGIAPWAMKIVHSFCSYTEVSPSEKGLRLFLRGSLPGTGIHKEHIEIYSQGRYLTLTGEHLPGTPWTIEARQEQIEALITILAAPKLSPAKESAVAGQVELTDAEVLERALKDQRFQALWQGDVDAYSSPSEADAALCALLTRHTRDSGQIERIFSRSPLVRPKWLKRTDYRRRTIEFALSIAPSTSPLLTPIPRPGGSTSPNQIETYDSDLEFAEDVLALVGVHHVELRVPFCSPWSSDPANHYMLYLDSSGRYTCRNASDPNERFTLTHLYAAWICGLPPRDMKPLPRVSLATYKMRLLIELGRIDPPTVWAPSLPPDAPRYATEAYAGFLLLLRCRQAYSGVLGPAPYSQRWATCWQPATFDKARRGIYWLIERGFLRPAGAAKGTPLFTIREPLE